MTKEKNTKGLVVFITKEFDLKLKQYLLDLEKVGVQRTKADAVARLAQIGLMNEIKNLEN